MPEQPNGRVLFPCKLPPLKQTGCDHGILVLVHVNLRRKSDEQPRKAHSTSKFTRAKKRGLKAHSSKLRVNGEAGSTKRKRALCVNYLLDERLVPHAVHVLVDTIKEVCEELLAAQEQDVFRTGNAKQVRSCRSGSPGSQPTRNCTPSWFRLPKSLQRLRRRSSKCKRRRPSSEHMLVW